MTDEEEGNEMHDVELFNYWVIYKEHVIKCNNRKEAID